MRKATLVSITSSTSSRLRVSTSTLIDKLRSGRDIDQRLTLVENKISALIERSIGLVED